MSEKKVKAGEFYYYAPGGIVKIVHIKDDEISGTLLKYPDISYNILIDPKQLLSQITDKDQIKNLEHRIWPNTNIPFSTKYINPDGF